MAPSPASLAREGLRLAESGTETVTELTPSERDTLKRLVACALQDRVSALKDLANESREQLYVLFAKLSGELCEPCRSKEEAASPPWPAGRRVVKD